MVEEVEKTREYKLPTGISGNVWIFGRIGCLDEDTEITINMFGVLHNIKLKCLPKKFNVISYNFKKGEIEISKAQKIFSGIKDCYKITFKDSNKNVIATKEHKFFNKNHRAIKVENLKKGDKLFWFTNERVNHYKEIEQIELIGQRKTFDLQVPGNDNFFLANGLLSHNSGKTCKLLTIAQSLYEHGYKIIDIDGGKRNEGAYWTLPNDDLALWEQLESETYQFEEPGPKKYKVNLLYPMFSEKLPEQLPEDTPRVKCKVFTIPFKDIEEKHVNLVLGSMSNKSKMLWQKVQDNTSDKSNSYEIDNLIDLKFPKLKDQAIYQLFFKELLKNNFISNSTSKLNINWIEEMKEKDVITVLCLDYVPERYHRFIRGWILTTLLDLAMKDKIGKKNLAFMREVSSFLKVVDANPVVEEVNKVYRNIFTDVARYARSGLFLAADTQDPSEVGGAVEGSEDILAICEMPSQKSREYTCRPLIRDRRMNEAQMRYIAVMPIHQVCLVLRGMKAKILNRIQPPRCKYFKPQYGNFESVWRKEVDKWIYTKTFIDIANEESKAREDYVLKLQLEMSKKMKDAIEEDDEIESESEDIEKDDQEKIKLIKIKKPLHQSLQEHEKANDQAIFINNEDNNNNETSEQMEEENKEDEVDDSEELEENNEESIEKVESIKAEEAEDDPFI